MVDALTNEHLGTVKGLLGITLAELLGYVAPILTVIVLLLTATNLVLEIRKKIKKKSDV